ncbi:hypothetical protein ACISSW_27030, partial [Escherichia coli]
MTEVVTRKLQDSFYVNLSRGALSTSGKNVGFPFPPVTHNANHISTIFPGLSIQVWLNSVFLGVKFNTHIPLSVFLPWKP